MQHGVYLLILKLLDDTTVHCKKVRFDLKAGWYYYCGSAMNGLSARINRHLSDEKKNHWHIDFLLEHGQLQAAVPFVVHDARMEHELAAILHHTPGMTPVPGFGASDCNCNAHLFHSEELVHQPFMKKLFERQMELAVDGLAHQYEGIETPVESFKTPWEILVSCVISLRTKDEVTGPASKRLFQRAPGPDELAQLDPHEIGQLIYPAGFYKTKGTNLKEIARIIRDKHDGRVPDNKRDLLALPGVGIKTANLVLADGYGQYEICVDTHVHRICNRMGWIQTRTPEESENVLKDLLPRSIIRETNGLMVKHGQQICKPHRPYCDRCPITGLCNTGMQHENDSR